MTAESVAQIDRMLDQLVTAGTRSSQMPRITALSLVRALGNLRQTVIADLETAAAVSLRVEPETAAEPKTEGTES